MNLRIRNSVLRSPWIDGLQFNAPIDTIYFVAEIFLRIFENLSTVIGPNTQTQLESIYLCRNDYVYLSVNESNSFHVWGSELGDYDIS